MGAQAPVKYHYSYRFFTYSVKRSRGRRPLFLVSKRRRTVATCGGLARSALKTVSGGEFDWGGTSVKR